MFGVQFQANAFNARPCLSQEGQMSVGKNTSTDNRFIRTSFLFLRWKILQSKKSSLIDART